LIGSDLRYYGDFLAFDGVLQEAVKIVRSTGGGARPPRPHRARAVDRRESRFLSYRAALTDENVQFVPILRVTS
jgi:hypothetical protein